MVSDLFDAILQELARALDVKDLHLDDQNTCLVKFPSGTEVYIEPHEKDEFMILCTEIGEIAPGRYREDVFREALKANGLPYPRHGAFAFSTQSNKLLLFKMFALKDLNGERIADYLTSFIEKAEAWKKHIERGVVPVADTMKTSSTGRQSGIFGLHP